MTPPTVQFIPAAAAGGLVWDISGTFDQSFGTGARDDDPTITLPSGGITGLLYVGSRQDSSYGVAFVFNNNTNRDAFVSAYPSDFGQVTYRDTLNNTDVTTISGWSWNTGTTGRAYIPTTNWTNWQTVSSSLIGVSYTLQA